MELEPKKFNLTDQEKDLKLYMFTVQKGNHFTIIPSEDFKIIMAYNKDDAILEVRKFYDQNVPLAISERFALDIKKVVGNLNLDQAEVIQVEVPQPPSKGKKVEDFINGMLLIANEFVIIEEDKKQIEKIIKRVKDAIKRVQTNTDTQKKIE